MIRRCLLLALLSTAALAAPAQAIYRAPCRGGHSGPKCFFWNAKVDRVNDGDTLTADIDGDGTHKLFKVRFSSIQAMEQSVYSIHPERRRGQCHALEATAFDEKMIKASHKRIKLSSQNRHAMSDVRLRRTVWVREHGKWTNLGILLMRGGYTLWLPGLGEDVWNATYDLLGQQARQDGKNMWDPTFCGVGPHQDVPLRAWVNWDPLGVDVHEVQHEWVKVQNMSPTITLPLTGWWIRDSNHRQLNFPKGMEIPPGGTVTVYTGKGTDDANSVYWNFKAPIFENPGDRHHLGDGAYLFDPQGDLRLAAQYPCLVACSDPLDNAIQLQVQPRGQREYVDVENVSGADADLYGYQLVKPGYQYLFDPGSVLHAGETLRLYANGSPRNDSRLVRYWGYNKPIYADSGGNILFRNFTDKTLSCDSWGNGRC